MAEDFAAILTIRDFNKNLDTLCLFDINHDDSDKSPIDQFIENSLCLNKIWATGDLAKELDPEMGILLLLGYISAVESYMRALIRRLIACDQFAQQDCESFQVSFGAALHHKQDVLPESLLEETTFSGKEEISKALNKFIKFNTKNNKTINSLLDQYEVVCQLRHCCVHRFGKLGVKNAISFGLKSHKNFLEKPILLKKDSISDIADLLITLIKSINIEVFRHVMNRSATGKLSEQKDVGIGWTWNKRNDKRAFENYYSIFSSQKDAIKSPPADEAYERFRSTYKNVGSKKPVASA